MTAERTTEPSIPAEPGEYCYVETAIGGADRRGHVERVENFTPSRHATDAYRSVFYFTEDLRRYTTDSERNRRYAETGRPSVAGYAGPAMADGVHLELDAPGDLPRAQRELRLILAALEERDIPREAVALAFSGSKGFHLSIPAALFGGFEPLPCRELARRIKRLAQRLLGGLGVTSIDWGVYDATRLWRCENTKHSKCGRYCIPVTAAGALGDLDALLQRASQPRQVERLPVDEWLPRPELVQLWEQTATAAPSARAGGEPRGPIPDTIPAGKRHNTIRRAAVRLAKQGYSEAEIAGLLLVMNAARCDPPLPEEEVRALAAWAAALPADELEDDDAWCPRCAPRAAALEEKLDRSRRRQGLVIDDNQRLQSQIASIDAVCASTGAQSLKITAIALARLVEDEKRRGRDGIIPLLIAGRDPWPGDIPDDAPAPVAQRSLAARSGQSPATVSRHLQELERLTDLRILRETQRDPRTGQPRTHCRIDLQAFNAERFLRQVGQLQAGGSLAAGETIRVRHGGRRTKCPACGCEEAITVKICARCGHELSRCGPVHQDDMQAEQPARFGEPERGPAYQDALLYTNYLMQGDAAPSFPEGARDRAIAELLRRYHRVEAAHGPPRLVWAGRVLWRREQLIEVLIGLNGDAPGALRALSAQLDAYDAGAPPRARGP